MTLATAHSPKPPEAPLPPAAALADPDRPLGVALRRGWMCRCPACGAGPMLKSYLKVRDHCPVCHEALYHQRADDGPAYLTILIVGHVIAPLFYVVYTHFRPDPLTMAAVFSVGTIALSLFLLPRLKGMLVALQWSRRMHGFAAPLTTAAPAPAAAPGAAPQPHG